MRVARRKQERDGAGGRLSSLPRGRSVDEASGQLRNASRSGHLTETNSRVLASGGFGFVTLRASPGRRRRLVFQLDNLELDD
jgi:hypothetical protein